MWAQGQNREDNGTRAARMENVKEIKAELGGTERKLAEGLGHSREIGRLLGLVELVGRLVQMDWLGDLQISIQDLDVKGGQLKETGEKLALTSARYLWCKRFVLET